MGNRHRRGAAAAAALVTLALWSVSTPAFAADSGSYAPPPPPQTPSLVGSSVEVSCVRDVPVISYRVVLTDPADASTGHDAVLVITDGTNRVELPLGDVSAGELTGTLLWPGASVDRNGNGTGWPGWILQDGAWVETPGNFGWTRADITATIQVNPEIAVPMAYPPATSACASPITGTPLSAGGGTPLAATGGDAMVIAVVGGAAVAAIAAGSLALATRRRRRV